MRLSHNIIANFAGQAITLLVGFVTVPLFLRFLGTEGYGLVSLLLVLQSLTSILDFGISATATREVASYMAHGRDARDRADLVSTLSVSYYGLAALILMGFLVLSPFLATQWASRTTVDAATLKWCLVIAGATIALRWPTSLYQGILRGTERQVILNVVTGGATLIRGVGSILVLAFVTRSVVGFYWAQLGFALVELALFLGAFRGWSEGFAQPGGRFDRALLVRLWKFSASVGGLSLFALILKQFDKLAISAFLPLTQLGFYNAASVAANGLTKVAVPVQAAVFPRLTRQHQQGDAPALLRTFHLAVQGIMFLTTPLAFGLIFYSRDILALWTRSSELAASAAPALAVLGAATLFNTMMSVPFSLLLASGLTWVPLLMNGIGAVVLAPLTFWLVQRDGITGAAVAWLVFNVVNYLVVPPVLFKRILPGGYRAWLLSDTLPFAVIPLACFSLAWWLTDGSSLYLKAAGAIVASAVYAVLVLAISPLLRETLRALKGVLRS